MTRLHRGGYDPGIISKDSPARAACHVAGNCTHTHTEEEGGSSKLWNLTNDVWGGGGIFYFIIGKI